jgi:hypothetical protein
MKVLLDGVLLLAMGLLLATIALGLRWPFTNMAEGELRCESGGAVVVRIVGKDYATNGMASTRFPPIQSVWNQDNFPGANIDRIIASGLTLCDW